MPGAITHELIAAAAICRLPKGIAPMTERAPQYYYLGSQGGDLLFFYKPLSAREYNFGKFVHRYRVYGLFCAMCDYLKTLSGEELEKARAYCLGYVSHYSADVCFHPFVYRYLKREKRGGKLVHTRVENDWDVYFARTKKGAEAEHYAFPFEPAAIAREDVLYRLYSAVARSLGRREISESALSRALKNYGRYLKFFHGNCYRHARRGETLARVFKIRAVSHLYPRATPSEEVLGGTQFPLLTGGKGATADELFERAADDSARRMILFLAAVDGAPLPRGEFSRHLLTGEETVT